MPGRPIRIVAVVVAAVIVIGTGVAWGKIRSFEAGINHISAAALGGGGDDGAIDILLVGMDSRTDAHGNPLSADELATLRAGDDVSTNTDTIILVRIPNNGQSATAISIPRDSYVEAPGDLGKTKINGVFGQVKLEKMKELVEQQGEDPAVAEPKATEAGREALIKTVADPDRRHRRPLRRDRAARVRPHHRRARRRRRLPQGRRRRTPVRRRLPRGPAEARRPAGAELRAAAPRPAAGRPRPGDAPAGRDGRACPPGHLGQDAVQPRDAEPAAGRRAALGRAVRRLGHHGLRPADAEAGRRQGRLRHHSRSAGGRLERRRHAERRAGRPLARCRTSSRACCTTRTPARPNSSRTRRPRPPPTS